MSAKAFVDSNLWLYAFALRPGEETRHKKARQLIEAPVRYTISEQVIAEVVKKIAVAPVPDPGKLLSREELQRTEKWDWALPDRLFFANYVASRFDLAGAIEACAALSDLD